MTPSGDDVGGVDVEPNGVQPAYEMKISMSVLEALGINLYSNAAAVVSELVANAWDADANLVKINWNASGDDAFVEIIDDGIGMTQTDLRGKFLTVGYSKRITEGGSSDGYARPFMGRKGIGKLSVFSIADTVEVHSARGGERNALQIEVDELKERIEQEKPYHPEEVGVDSSITTHGTIIRLTNLRRRRIDVALNALRKRVARRFDVLTLVPPMPTSGESSLEAVQREIGYMRSRAQDESLTEQEREAAVATLATTFYVTLNGAPITFDDRTELKKLEYVWEFGEANLPEGSLSRDVKRTIVSGEVAGNPDWKVTGWFGTTAKPDQLIEDDEAGSLKNIMVLSRGRPIQEGILERLDFSRMFVSYTTGQIRADFLDADDQDDIATSDRQRLMEDDPRVEALREFLRAALLKASDQWSDWRPQKKAKEVLESNEPIRTWIDSLPPYQRDPATKLMGTIESLSIPESTDAAKDKRRLFQSGIIAFERIGLREDVERLNQLSSMQTDDILHVLATLDSYESAMYLDLIRARIETIHSFEDDVAENVLEKVLQEKLHSNLWLLDPAWDRISQDVTIEERIFELAESFGADRPEEDALKRIDLRYCNVQNRHVIIELKRPNVKPDIDVLYDQGLTYLRALSQILEETGRSDEPYEVIFVVGQKPGARKAPPSKNPDDYSRERVAELNGRVFRYQELIHRARAQYAEYIEKNKNLTRISEVLDALTD
ncbi:hypothetical protein CW368_11870 [Actinomycetales bacterium SN12]|nr:hypothetical protein CW368_11870 [Actinomycetales bacterium SN12]